MNIEITPNREEQARLNNEIWLAAAESMRPKKDKTIIKLAAAGILAVVAVVLLVINIVNEKPDTLLVIANVVVLVAAVVVGSNVSSDYILAHISKKRMLKAAGEALDKMFVRIGNGNITFSFGDNVTVTYSETAESFSCPRASLSVAEKENMLSVDFPRDSDSDFYIFSEENIGKKVFDGLHAYLLSSKCEYVTLLKNNSGKYEMV